MSRKSKPVKSRATLKQRVLMGALPFMLAIPSQANSFNAAESPVLDRVEQFRESLHQKIAAQSDKVTGRISPTTRPFSPTMRPSTPRVSPEVLKNNTAKSNVGNSTKMYSVSM
jgi:hypothetical protein